VFGLLFQYHIIELIQVKRYRTVSRRKCRSRSNTNVIHFIPLSLFSLHALLR